MVVWWAWIYATWMVNWFDPGSTKVRLIVAGVALTSLLMSAAIPTAFGSEAWLFAGAYVFMQIGRNVAATTLIERTWNAVKGGFGRSEPTRNDEFAGRSATNFRSDSRAKDMTLWNTGAATTPPKMAVLGLSRMTSTTRCGLSAGAKPTKVEM